MGQLDAKNAATNTDWLVAYTKPRNEKKVLERLQAMGIDVYLPLQRTLKQWSDRKKWVNEPLFRSYIFVRPTLKEYYSVVQTDGVVRYVSFAKQVSKVPNSTIEQIKYLLNEPGVNIEVSQEHFAPGTHITISMGAMRGMEGEVVEHRGTQKLIVRMESISHSILVTLPRSYVELTK